MMFSASPNAACAPSIARFLLHVSSLTTKRGSDLHSPPACRLDSLMNNRTFSTPQYTASHQAPTSAQTRSSSDDSSIIISPEACAECARSRDADRCRSQKATTQITSRLQYCGNTCVI
ncbi:hypothetical protein KC19_3G192600 [Ceratodon purpureus]|uniref:Uncharacterized protein n=1 Tax=Ceratodon purpureus TaxID=3225 RepID=A0A8T0IMX9_CERPU|nr:hypothetical protein KC19_3G192600 [Ceratodon purpureus]